MIIFKYDLSKDMENFLNGLRSVNSSVPTKFQEEYESVYGINYDEHIVKDFLEKKSRGLNTKKIASDFQNQWNKIEKAFISRCEELFGITLPPNPIAYLTQNQKCTYNWKGNYFFVYFDSKYPNKTVMHELLHFYTHRKYESLNIERQKFNDIKESLTVLLNIEFRDLLGEAVDNGYPQHQQMRIEISEMRKGGKSIDEIVKQLS